MGHTDIWGLYWGHTDVWQMYRHRGGIQMYEGIQTYGGHTDVWGFTDIQGAHRCMGNVQTCRGHTDVLGSIQTGMYRCGGSYRQPPDSQT